MLSLRCFLFCILSVTSILTVYSQPGASVTYANYQIKWKFKTNGAIRSTVTVSNDLLFFGSADGNLYAINKAGKEKWKFKTSAAVHCRPALKGTTLYFTSRDHFLYAVNSLTGKLLWKYQLGNTLLSHLWGWEYFLSSPVINGDLVYAGGADGYIYALNSSTGKLAWKFKTAGRVRCTATIKDNTFYCGSYDGYLYALDKNNGQLKWKFETDGVHLNSDSSGWDRISIDSKPAIAGNRLVFGSRDGNVYALNTETGKEEWRFTYGPTWAIGSPTIDNNTVYIGWSDNFLFSAIDLQTGKEKWKYKAGYYVYSSPAVDNNMVLVGSHDGNLYCFNKEDGRKLWQYRTEGAVYSSPVLESGLIYVGSDDGNMYAFKNEQKPGLLKAVFAPRDKIYQSWLVDTRLPSYLYINGFEMLDSSAVGQFMEKRINDGKSSVLVLAPYLLTSKMIEEDNAGSMLIRRYMENGGRIVWLGTLPNLYQYDTSGNFLGEDPTIAKKILEVELDLVHDAGWYNCEATAEGKKCGLPDWYISSFSVKPQHGIIPLAINEYGRPTTWIKKIGDKGGLFIQARVWPQDKGAKDLHLELIKKLAEYEY